MSWFTSSKAVPSFLVHPEYVWFAYVILEIEEEQEDVINFWKTLVQELRESEEIGLDAAMKATATKRNVSVPNSNFLSIYRWHNQLVDTPVDHPLMPLVAQKYFHYFLKRPQPNTL